MNKTTRINKDIDYSMDGSVKQLFLNLTKMQIIFNKEDTLSEYFPDDMQTDEHGNFFLQIAVGVFKRYCSVSMFMESILNI